MATLPAALAPTTLGTNYANHQKEEIGCPAASWTHSKSLEALHMPLQAVFSKHRRGKINSERLTALPEAPSWLTTCPSRSGTTGVRIEKSDCADCSA